MIHIVIKNAKFLKFAGYLFNMHLNGLTLWPFIIIKDKTVGYHVINHEKIHIAQCEELLVVGFYILFGIEYLINLCKYKDRFMAYREILFEKEAYDHMYDKDYLRRRKFFAWLRR